MPRPPASAIAIASISVSPAAATLSVGQTVPYAATLYDSAQNVLTGRPVVWLSSAPNVVSIDSTGSATARSAGAATITASSAGILGAAPVTVGSTATNPPSTVTDLAAVASSDSSAALSFTAVGDGTGGNASYEVRYAAHPISWGTATSAASGSCRTPIAGTNTGTVMHCTVSGLAPATNYDFQLVAFRGTLNTQSAVFSQLSNIATAATSSPAAPTVSKVVVSPASVTDTAGAHHQFSASVQDSQGNVLSGHTVTWSSSASSVATVNSSGYATTVTPGTASIVATSDGVSGSATVTVTAAPPVLQQLILTPATAAVQVGATQQFSVSGKMSDGSTTSVTATYTATGGSITSGGLYTAGSTAGSYRVIAKISGGTLADTSTVTVTAAPPVLQQLILTPATASVQVGATQQFSVSGKMSDGSTTSVTASYTATGGTITSSGLYTAGSTAGTYRVIATVSGGTLADTSRSPFPQPPCSATDDPHPSDDLSTGRRHPAVQRQRQDERRQPPRRQCHLHRHRRRDHQRRPLHRRQHGRDLPRDRHAQPAAPSPIPPGHRYRSAPVLQQLILTPPTTSVQVAAPSSSASAAR